MPTSPPPIVYGQAYKTRGGSPVRLYAIYPNQEDAVHGAILNERAGRWQPWSWQIDGMSLRNGQRTHVDLVPA